jgi:acyl-coenzyme A synthetase/AMP-(fatty) acid ligase
VVTGRLDVWVDTQVSSIELERVCAEADAAVAETAAVGVSPPQGGPERLTVFAVLRDGVAQAEASPERLRVVMGDALRRRLNPLFKVGAVHVVSALPRTATNKVMRRELRALAQASPNSKL